MDSFSLMFASMTPAERERAEWITGAGSCGRWYDDGYTAGVSEAEAVVYEEGFQDGFQQGQLSAQRDE